MSQTPENTETEESVEDAVESAESDQPADDDIVEGIEDLDLSDEELNFAPEDDGESSPEDEVVRLEGELASMHDKLLRAVAETENVRRRAQRDKEDTARYAVSNFSRDLLSVADNLRRALDSVDEDARKESPALENLMIGVEMTERELLAAFERTNIRRMETIGQRFDPNFHEAMFEYDDPDQPAKTVGQEIEAGYMLHDRALRPAKVGVTKGGPKEEAPAAGSPGNTPESGTYEPKAGEPGATFDEEL
ncbi:MAG: nucleotide exchange factor GrpE [Rhodospirillales bacterium]|jgi:molecular chaperone GrpE|nr:nucleotide exchange factor GrpE [Rhodospirillales bacterium]MBT4040787.1 nucleotide exchange factor GrpE [Rhodospirillales bacterium]MBT4627658.1 nucleotide exchange factor GrpE [Rhodospirillales bacterium]MBT5352027.1 nucleotide exchange factor GrpE [Rhodospirillales bacterium]MBT5521796.1 nucleotide exchange factor GrpE [Rhodospirillales bacterium]